MPNQGVFKFLNITGEISASTTFTKGINPSVTRVTITANTYRQLEANGTRIGTAQWFYNGTLVRELPFSAIDSVQSVDQGGLTSFQVMILDRRWGWQFGQISGEYNITRSGEVIPDRMKTPQELAVLCLKAMGEANYDVSQLPNDDLPYVAWDVTVPAKALADIADLGGCDVVLAKNNSVKLVKRGQGAYLPPASPNTNVARLTYQKVLDPKEYPKSMFIVTGPTRWQADFRLMAVGYEDEESDPKPLTALSYAPTGQTVQYEGENVEAPGGWHLVEPDSDFYWITNEKTRELAKKHAFRTFQIMPIDYETDPEPSLPLADGYTVPAGARLKDSLAPIIEMKQMLPVSSDQVQTEGFGETRKPKDAVVWGRFFDGELGGNTIDKTANLEREDYLDKLIYQGSVSVDEEAGLVMTGDFMRLEYELTDNREGEKEVSTRKYPELFLRCSVNLKHPDTYALQRYGREYVIDATSPAGSVYITREDIVPEYHEEIASGSLVWKDNLADVQQQIQFYAIQALVEYQSFPAESATYMGFVDCDVDGAIAQIDYGIDQSGECSTSVSRNVEISREAPTYKEARRSQKITEAIDDRERRKRTEKSADAKLKRVMEKIDRKRRLN